jgi:hypothetical protein
MGGDEASSSNVLLELRGTTQWKLTRESVGIAPRISNFATRWRWVISFNSWLLYSYSIIHIGLDQPLSPHPSPLDLGWPLS